MESKKDVLEQLDKWWLYTVDHPTTRAEKDLHIKCFQYREGDQYTPAELKTFRERGQPDTVDNRVAVTINKLMGDFVERKYRIGWRGRNEAVDKDTAKDLSDIFLYIRQANKLQFEETDMCDDGFTSGFGCLEVFVEFDDLFQPEIKVRHEDSLVVFRDPDSRRYDWNEDARFLFRARWFDADDIIARYPDAKKHIEGLSAWDGGTGETSTANNIETFMNKNYIDANRKKIRLLDCEWKEYKNQEIILFDDPSGEFPIFSIKKDDPAAKQAIVDAKAANIEMETITRVMKTIHRAVFVGGKILEHKETRQKYFSLIPYIMYRKKDGTTYSLIALGLSMQDAINKRGSKAIHLFTTNQTIFERGAVHDKDKLAEEIHKPDGQIEVADGALANQRVIFRNNIEMAQSQFMMHQAAERSFSEIVGVDTTAGVNTGELRGSAALQRKFSEIGKPVARIFENLSRTRNILGTVLLDFVQLYMTPQKVMMITDDQEAQQRFVLSKDRVARIKQAQFDTVVDDFIDSPTIQQEQWALMMQYLPQVIPLGPFWTKKFIEMSDLRDKDSTLKEMAGQEGPPPVEPRLSVQANINELLPVERAFFYERMGAPEVAQAVRAQNPQTTTELKGTVDIAKTKISQQTKEDQNANKESA